jgi:hypothetical protein
LVVLRINAPGLWPRASFLPAGAMQGLGGVISPPTTCGGVRCQYFEKGALAANGKNIQFLPLVTSLFTGAGVRLPVGGTTSSVNYASLAVLRAKQTPPPAGFNGGVVVGGSGTFVPFSARLAAVPGYIVPLYFWQYLLVGKGMPGGWLRSVGLPLTPVITATVTKGALGRRTISIQAYQCAVLTYDPHNPDATKVERANIGSDYASAFPAATR